MHIMWQLIQFMRMEYFQVEVMKEWDLNALIVQSKWSKLLISCALIEINKLRETSSDLWKLKLGLVYSSHCIQVRQLVLLSDNNWCYHGNYILCSSCWECYYHYALTSDLYATRNYYSNHYLSLQHWKTLFHYCSSVELH